MNFSDHHKSKIQRALAAAHEGRERPPAGEAWKAGVMRALRQTTIPESPSGVSFFFNQYLWRIVPVACALIVVLSAILIHLDVSLEYELAQGFISDPVAFRAEQFWGI